MGSSMNFRCGSKARRNRRHVASVACLAVAFAPSTLPRARHVLARSCCAQADSPARQAALSESGIITGIVVNERREPVARAQVQAFAARATIAQGQGLSDTPSSIRASGSASTDAAGRFRIAGLPAGEYLVTAAPVTAFPASSHARLYATTFYAAHLLGDLRNPNGVLALIPLLSDKEVNSIVPWSLGQIGDRRAIEPLLQALDEDDPSMRVRVIDALEALHAKEALPWLASLLADRRRANIASRISVSEAAARAIAALRQ